VGHLWSKIRTTYSASAGGNEVWLADQRMIGRVGRVTGTIAPGRIGEVMIAIRGGSEAFHAYATDSRDTISPGTRVVVVEYFPPRTVVVSPC
jgi:membrane protein implicated in regulation of membrane protease activity